MEPTITAVSRTQLRVTSTVSREDLIDKDKITEQIRQIRELIENNVKHNEENQRKIDELQAKLDLFNLPQVIDDISRLTDGRGGLVDGGDVVITNP